MEKILVVEDLKKYYGEIKAVDGISFYLETGKLFAFLGPNGSGKSTTIDTICTYLKPDGGNVIIDGHELGKDDDAIRKTIGVVFQDGLLDRMLTVEENIRTRASLYDLKGKELDEAVKRASRLAGTDELLKRKYGKLSGGQRRRCDIARALVNQPKILFLDEPTTGLDPQTRKNIWETITSLQKEAGMTVFLTTHYMEEAASADYVTVIDKGKVVAKGTPPELREKYASDKVVFNCTDTEKVKAILDAKKAEYTQNGNRITVNLKRTLDALPYIKEAEGYITGFEVTAGTMDDAFINITGKELREE
ncbi:MAG: ATP-binding cassette domain-containing protein [Eubacteriales bacterium]|jgi:multidrug/hemolysin transport system ATP-binding protein